MNLAEMNLAGMNTAEKNMDHRTALTALMFACVLALVGGALALQASPDRVVIDSQLQRRTVSDLRFAPGRIEFESGGRAGVLPLDGSVVAITEPNANAPRPRHSWLELTDGQRLVGSRVVLPSVAEVERAMIDAPLGVMPWVTPLLGEVRVPIESIRRIMFQEDAPRAEHDPLNDVLVLANGDRTLGLIERLWPKVVVDLDGRMRTIEPESIASITLANPRTERRGSALWLSDGSVVSAGTLNTSAAGVEIELATPLDGATPALAPLTMNEVLAVAFQSAGVRPLSELGMPQWQADGPWALPPRLGESDRALLGMAEIELVGPVTSRWRLPAGARRIAVRARLREDCVVWGDCEISMVVGGGMPSTARLHGPSPEALFTLDIDAVGAAGDLVVRVESGRGGAIQDRVLLDGFVLLTTGASENTR